MNNLQNQIDILTEIVQELSKNSDTILRVLERLDAQVREQENYIKYLQSNEDKTVCTQ